MTSSCGFLVRKASNNSYAPSTCWSDAFSDDLKSLSSMFLLWRFVRYWSSYFSVLPLLTAPTVIEQLMFSLVFNRVARKLKSALKITPVFPAFIYKTTLYILLFVQISNFMKYFSEIFRQYYFLIFMNLQAFFSLTFGDGFRIIILWNNRILAIEYFISWDTLFKKREIIQKRTSNFCQSAVLPNLQYIGNWRAEQNIIKMNTWSD